MMDGCLSFYLDFSQSCDMQATTTLAILASPMYMNPLLKGDRCVSLRALPILATRL